MLMSDTSSSEGEYAFLANASLADSAVKIEDFREGLKPTRGNAQEDSMIWEECLQFYMEKAQLPVTQTFELAHRYNAVSSTKGVHFNTQWPEKAREQVLLCALTCLCTSNQKWLH